MSGSQSSSPLTLQMLLASNQQQPQDPALMAALPRLQMAQAMMQNGVSDAPTSKWGGISRVGQALLGNYLFSDANSGLQNILQQRQADTANTLNTMRGTPTAPATPQPQAAAQPPPGGITGALGAAEGGSNPAAVNQQGYSGQYQFGASRLADPAVGVYTPSAGENLKANQWTGSFNIPGFPDVKSHADFLASPDAQKAVFGMHMADINNAIASTPGAAAMDPNGLRAVAHLGGTAGMQKFVQSNGQYDPADANGTHLSDYYNRFSAQPPGSVQVAGPGAPTGQAPAAGQPPGAPATPPANPQAAQAMDMMKRANDAIASTAANPYNPNNAGIRQAAAAQIQYAHELLSVAQGHVTVGPNGVQTTGTGEQKSAATPSLNYVQDPTTGAFISPGAKPVFPPSARMMNVPGTGLVTAAPGQAPTVAFPVNPSGIASAAAAAAQGSATGKGATAIQDKMFDLGRESDAAIGNIDYGMNQLHQAAAGGINSGYFAPWLATAAAAGKSLGVDTSALGIDPAAVGNVQSAQKTLGVVAGAILQQAIGKDSQITDAKIEHFIHTQPGIETDPQAIQRVLGWARSQFSYNRDMAMDAMQHTDPNTGMLPPGWRAQYVAKKGAFAPIYDPLSGEMAQPQGEGPATAPPGGPTPVPQGTVPTQSVPQGAPTPGTQPAMPARPAQAPAYHEGQTATHPNGSKVVFQGGQWVPVK